MLGFFRENEIWRTHFKHILAQIELGSEHSKKSFACKIYYIEIIINKTQIPATASRKPNRKMAFILLAI